MVFVAFLLAGVDRNGFDSACIRAAVDQDYCGGRICSSTQACCTQSEVCVNIGQPCPIVSTESLYFCGPAACSGLVRMADRWCGSHIVQRMRGSGVELAARPMPDSVQWSDMSGAAHHTTLLTRIAFDSVVPHAPFRSDCSTSHQPIMLNALPITRSSIDIDCRSRARCATKRSGSARRTSAPTIGAVGRDAKMESTVTCRAPSASNAGQKPQSLRSLRQRDSLVG